MAGRNERPLYEGKNRRVESRRQVGRRRSDRYKQLVKYAAFMVIAVLIVKLFDL